MNTNFDYIARPRVMYWAPKEDNENECRNH